MSLLLPVYVHPSLIPAITESTSVTKEAKKYHRGQQEQLGTQEHPHRNLPLGTFEKQVCANKMTGRVSRK